MRLLILIISVFLLLPSCRKGEVPSSPPSNSTEDNNTSGGDIDDERAKEITFTAGLSASIEQYNGSRAPIEGNTLPVGGKVGIWGVYADKEIWSIYPDAYRIYISGSQATMTNAEYEIRENNKLYQKYLAQYPTKDSGFNGLVVYGYYPYTENYSYDLNDKCFIKTTLDNLNMANTTDYLYVVRKFYETPSDDNTVATLEFKHALSRIHFNFNKTTTDVVLNKISVVAKSSLDGYLYVEDAKCVAANYNQVSALNMDCNNINLNTDEKVEYDYLLYPDTQIISITCYFNGEVEGKLLPGVSGLTLEAGKFVNININYSPKEAIVDGNLSVWEDSNTNMDFEIDEETGDVTLNQ